MSDAVWRRAPSPAARFDVLVIGGGTAGLVTASGCARLGRRVALIERAELGGDCLWSGCVPTKALGATARLAHQMRHATRWGLDAVEPRIDPKSIMESMREMQRIAGRHDQPRKFRDLGIEIIEGTARFVASDAIEVAGRRIAAKDIVIATGSRTAVPPIEGLQQTGFIDHATFLKGDAFPQSLLILGGGAIGIEFAQIFRRFGSKVTVVEMAGDIISREDHDVIARVRRIVEGEGIEIHAGWAAKSVRRDGAEKVARIEMKDGESRELRAAEVFVATARRGNIEDLGLDAAGVKTSRSYVVVNKYLQTSAPRIWACGDVHGGLQFTHVAAYEAVKLVRNMLFPGKSAVTYDDVPWALYTDPEAAHIGMTEREARQAFGDSVRTYTTEMIDVDRAVIERDTEGFLKLVCDAKGRILGAHAVCAHASTLMEEIAVARKRGMRAGDLAQLISSYPSMADSVSKAASQYYQDLSRGRLGYQPRRIAAWSQ